MSRALPCSRLALGYPRDFFNRLTSDLRAVFIDRDAQVVGAAGTHYGVSHPHADWITACESAVAALHKHHAQAFAAVRAIGLGGHMHGATLRAMATERDYAEAHTAFSAAPDTEIRSVTHPLGGTTQRVVRCATVLLSLIAPPVVGTATDLAAVADRLGPRPHFSEPDPDRVALGRLLFYDPVISGNRNISCATCHHPNHATGDGLSLGLGEGGIGLGTERSVDPGNPPEQRIPRNAQGLFNLGASTVTTFFHDGRLEADDAEPNGIRTPLGGDMVGGFDSALAAQAMFPVLSADEMAGHYNENPIALAVRQGRLTGRDGAWDLITRRVTELPDYRHRLLDVFGDERDIDFADLANLIADFIAVEWRADNSPFDQALRGESRLPVSAERGLRLFYGKANCASCHTGWLHTDQQFHAIGMPQLGPGKSARFESHSRDDGRLRVTGRAEDRYRFRTPSLRNVALTAPYGHAGAFDTLEAVVRHHLDPVRSLSNYDRTQAVLPQLPGVEDWREWKDTTARANLAQAIDIEPVALRDSEISDLLQFLHSLTDESWRARSEGVPATVPSGLPVDQ